jgi:hypothetical protein
VGSVMAGCRVASQVNPITPRVFAGHETKDFAWDCWNRHALSFGASFASTRAAVMTTLIRTLGTSVPWDRRLGAESYLLLSSRLQVGKQTSRRPCQFRLYTRWFPSPECPQSLTGAGSGYRIKG